MTDCHRQSMSFSSLGAKPSPGHRLGRRHPKVAEVTGHPMRRQPARTLGW